MGVEARGWAPWLGVGGVGDGLGWWRGVSGGGWWVEVSGVGNRGWWLGLDGVWVRGADGFTGGDLIMFGSKFNGTLAERR